MSSATIFLCGAVAFAQQPAQVSGVVRSAKTGEGIKSASVVLTAVGSDARSFRAVTGAEGAYGFSGLPPGRYQLAIRKPGYQPYQGSGSVAGTGEGAEPARLAVSLWPHGAISGRVLDWEGEPVAEAEVLAYAVAYEPNGAALKLAARETSDDSGEYRLFDLPAGKYVIHVSPPRNGKPAGLFYADVPAAYFPGVPGPAQALPVQLDWGQDSARVDVRLSAGKSYAVAGAVWNALTGSPCTRCVVQVVQREGPYRVTLPQTARVSRDGGFVIRGLPSGEYLLVSRLGGSRDTPAQALVSISNRHIEGVRLTVGRGQPVTGSIVLENASGAAGGEDWIPELSPVGLPEWWPRVEGPVAAGRQFAFESVPPARYRFDLKGLPAGAYLKTVRSGGEALPDWEVTVPEDTAVAHLQAVVAFDGATLQGKVHSAETAQPAARIFLLPQPGQDGFQVPRSTQAEADGSFSFVSVHPGRYTVYALPAMTSLQIFDPTIQTALAPYAREVRLESRQTASLEVPLTPPLR